MMEQNDDQTVGTNHGQTSDDGDDHHDGSSTNDADPLLDRRNDDFDLEEQTYTDETSQAIGRQIKENRLLPSCSRHATNEQFTNLTVGNTVAQTRSGFSATLGMGVFLAAAIPAAITLYSNATDTYMDYLQPNGTAPTDPNEPIPQTFPFILNATNTILSTAGVALVSGYDVLNGYLSAGSIGTNVAWFALGLYNAMKSLGPGAMLTTFAINIALYFQMQTDPSPQDPDAPMDPSKVLLMALPMLVWLIYEGVNEGFFRLAQKRQEKLENMANVIRQSELPGDAAMLQELTTPTKVGLSLWRSLKMLLMVVPSFAAGRTLNVIMPEDAGLRDPLIRSINIIINFQTMYRLNRIIYAAVGGIAKLGYHRVQPTTEQSVLSGLKQLFNITEAPTGTIGAPLLEIGAFEPEDGQPDANAVYPSIQAFQTSMHDWWAIGNKSNAPLDILAAGRNLVELISALTEKMQGFYPDESWTEDLKLSIHKVLVDGTAEEFGVVIEALKAEDAFDDNKLEVNFETNVNPRTTLIAALSALSEIEQYAQRDLKNPQTQVILMSVLEDLNDFVNDLSRAEKTQLLNRIADNQKEDRPLDLDDYRQIIPFLYDFKSDILATRAAQWKWPSYVLITATLGTVCASIYPSMANYIIGSLYIDGVPNPTHPMAILSMLSFVGLEMNLLYNTYQEFFHEIAVPFLSPSKAMRWSAGILGVVLGGLALGSGAGSATAGINYTLPFLNQTSLPDIIPADWQADVYVHGGLVSGGLLNGYGVVPLVLALITMTASTIALVAERWIRNNPDSAVQRHSILQSFKKMADLDRMKNALTVSLSVVKKMGAESGGYTGAEQVALDHAQAAVNDLSNKLGLLVQKTQGEHSAQQGSQQTVATTVTPLLRAMTSGRNNIVVSGRAEAHILGSKGAQKLGFVK